MTPRMSAFEAAPSLMKSWLDFGTGLTANGLERSLMELVKIRASQINGCAFCLEMHTREARNAGESEARIYLLDAWHESPLYSPRERAALGWTDALTRLSEAPPSDAAFEELKAHFSEEEIVKLTLLIVTINGWNRINVGLRTVHPVRAAHRPAA